MAITRRDAIKTAVASSLAAACTVLGGRVVAGSVEQTHTVKIKQFTYKPQRLIVRAGDRIRWVNEDIVPHTATALDGSWDTGEIAANAAVELTITGEFSADYYCLYHPSMTASLELEA